MGFLRQEYWSGLPFSSSGDLPKPGIKPSNLCLLHWQVDSYCWASGEAWLFSYSSAIQTFHSFFLKWNSPFTIFINYNLYESLCFRQNDKHLLIGSVYGGEKKVGLVFFLFLGGKKNHRYLSSTSGVGPWYTRYSLFNLDFVGFSH